MENGGCHVAVCWCWLCVIGGYESSRCALIYIYIFFLKLGPMLSSRCLRLQGVVVQHRAPIKGRMSSSETRPSKYTILMVASKKGRQTETVHKKKKKKNELQDKGGWKGTKGNGGWTDLQREKRHKLDQAVLTMQLKPHLHLFLHSHIIQESFTVWNWFIILSVFCFIHLSVMWSAQSWL